MTFRSLRVLALSCSVACLGGMSVAQTVTKAAPQITQEIDNNFRVTVHGSTSPAVRKAVDLGTLSPSTDMKRMILVMKPTDAQEAALRSLLEAQQTQSSPIFHQWLTPAQFAASYAPASADVQKVVAWLQQQGFTDVKPARGGRWIEFSGTSSSVETAFQTSMHKFQIQTTSGPEEHTANATDISIPQALAPVVSGVLSLNNFFSKPMHTSPVALKRNSAGKMVRINPDFTTTDGDGDFAYALAPADVQKIYNATPVLASGIDGTGVSIAVVGRVDVLLTDIQGFRTVFGLPSNDPNFIVSGPDPGSNNLNDMAESSLDLEWAGAVAPKATINFVTAAATATTDGVDLAEAYAVENLTSPILTSSYGYCEALLGPDGNRFNNSLWEQAAAEGISVFVSAGDGGAAECDRDLGTGGPSLYGPSINGLASTPYNVAVGGTQFNEGALTGEYWDANTTPGTQESALGYIPEMAWNQSCDPTLPVGVYGNCPYGQTNYNIGGGGGGMSSCSSSTVDNSENVTCVAGYAKPSWQSVTGVPKDSVRDIPDVSLNASPEDDGYEFCFLGGCQYTVTPAGIVLQQISSVGGTSASTPTMASILALVEQKNGAWIGLPNYKFYQLAAKQNPTNCNSSYRTNTSVPTKCVFNDITEGSNSVPGLPGYGTAKADYTTTPGYDLATGLGSVDVNNLVSAWSSLSTIASSTQLTTATTTGVHGQAIKVNVAVKASTGSGTPSGDILLTTDKYGAESSYPLAAGGTFSGSVSDLPGGTYNLSARYAGDATYSSSTSAGTSITITPEPSKQSLFFQLVDPYTGQYSPLTGTQTYGTPIYMTASVAGASGQGTPTGTVTILDGKTVLATGPLNASASVLLNTSAIAPGARSLTVSYSGDNSFNAGTSRPFPLVIDKGPDYIYTGAANNFQVGQPAMLTAFVSAPGPVLPTGTVQLFDNGVAISPKLPVTTNGLVGSGYPQINFNYTYTTPGTHVLTASYSGDGNYLSLAQNSPDEQPANFTLTPVTGALTVTTMKMTSASTLQMGQIATFVVAVAPLGKSNVLPTGQVFIFGNGVDDICSATLVNGKGYGTCYMDGPANYKLTAQYQGDNNFQPSTSAASGTLTIPKATPVVGFTTTAANVLAGTQTSLNFTATGIQINPWVQQDPTGTVTFTDSVNGGATQMLGNGPIFPLNSANPMLGGYSTRATLPAGTNVLTASFSGDPNFNPTVSTVTVIVGSPDFNFVPPSASLTLTAGTTVTSSIALTPVLGYTGPVALACAGGVPAGATCAFNPATVTLGAAQTTTLALSLPAPSPSPQSSTSALRWTFTGGGLMAAGVFFLLPKRRRRIFGPYAALLLLGCTGWTLGCGSSPSPKATLLALTSSNTKVASKAEITLTANLNALETKSTGTVTFYDGNASIGSAPLTSGSAQLQISSLAVGAHTITSKYSGDKNNEPASSTAIVQVITGSTNLQITATSGTLTHSSTLIVTIN